MLYALHEPLNFKPEFWGFEVRTYYSAIERGSKGVKGLRLSVKRMNYSTTVQQSFMHACEPDKFLPPTGGRGTILVFAGILKRTLIEHQG